MLCCMLGMGVSTVCNALNVEVHNKFPLGTIKYTRLYYSPLYSNHSNSHLDLQVFLMRYSKVLCL